MKYVKYLIVGVITQFLFACNSLDLSPEDYFGAGNFWKNETQVERYVLGLHSDLRDAYSTFYLLGEARGGTSKSGTSFVGTSLDNSSPIKTNTFSRHLTGVTNWGGLYAKVLNVNLLIERLETECSFLSESSRSYYLGQAYGLRAFYYFWLYRTYGGVPLVEDPEVINGVTGAETLYRARSSAKETMDFIKENLRLSEQYFGENWMSKKEKGMWSKAATLVLKAEVYLWSAKVTTQDQKPEVTDIQTAKNALQLLYGRFSLQSSFANVFTYENKGNDEIILAIRFEDGEMENNIRNFIYSPELFYMQFYDKEGEVMNDPLNSRGTGLLRHEYKWGLFAAMDDEDTRKYATFLDCYNEDGSAAGIVLRKFMGLINTNGNRVYCDDYVLYRYADVLLMLAETANMEGGDVAYYLNQVRQRAYGEKYNGSLHGYVNGSFGENELAILKERDKEFVWEGKRWFDLVRLQDDQHRSLAFSPSANYDDPSSVLKENEAYKLLWPIDVNTLSNDPKLVNNPGYEQ